MSAKTSQLQIRVTPDQKDSLKRLAAEAGLSVSEYVLATVLPSAGLEFESRIENLKGTGLSPKALSDLMLYLSDLSVTGFAAATAGPDLSGLSLLFRNYLAAAVEQEAGRKGVDPPAWTHTVDPLPEPAFAWRLPSLQPHLMRVTPLAFKRRNVFVAALHDMRR
jgi:uncharacterized protein (DUF1778 family)